MPKSDSITISAFHGFCPAYFEDSYPYAGIIGNQEHLSAMQDIDLINPSVMTQGPGFSDLTNGNESGVVDKLISDILNIAPSSDVSYACGENKVFKFSSSAVTDDTDWPFTIDKAGVTSEDADSLIYYKSNLLIFYNHSGGNGDIAKITLSGPSLDANWGATQDTALEDAPHYPVQGGDDVVYFTNGQYIGTIEGTTVNTQGLDFWANAEVNSLTWNYNRVYAAVNRPNVTGSNFSQSGIYRWNGVSSSWEGDPIEVSGRIGALYTKNGVTYVWWEDIANGNLQFGHISGGRLKPLRRFEGSLPNQSQVGEVEGHIAWISNNEILLWGAKDENVPVKMFQYCTGADSTLGAFASPFGTLLVSSTDGSTKYTLAEASGYTTTSTAKTMAFKVSGINFKFQIDSIKIRTNSLSSGAKLDTTLTYDQAKSSQSLTQIAYDATDDATIHKILEHGDGKKVEDFRLDFDWSNGSASNPVEIREVLVEGKYVSEN